MDPAEQISDPVTALITSLPLDLTFATKGELVIDLLSESYADNVRLDFVADDEVYGACTKLRAFLDGHRQPRPLPAHPQAPHHRRAGLPLLLRPRRSAGHAAPPDPAAGLRWPVEESFEAGKSLFGLDESQVRLYEALLRHIVLVMAALAVCVTSAAAARNRTDTQAMPPSHPDEQPPENPGLIPPTVAEIKHLFNATRRVRRWYQRARA
ncbi:hypothetical protein GCM10022419_009940 [Nonomuraea rosea]|uniref:Uncharacterized protein n=1 Tax=Nonomuraea rosea TaxID=638574 RepID=A0ABP6VD80_9ACTN